MMNGLLFTQGGQNETHVVGSCKDEMQRDPNQPRGGFVVVYLDVMSYVVFGRRFQEKHLIHGQEINYSVDGLMFKIHIVEYSSDDFYKQVDKIANKIAFG